MKLIVTIVIIILVAVGFFVFLQNNKEEILIEKINMSELKLTSSAFEYDGNIPSKYTCDGENIAPDLNIEGIPENTKSLVLIMDDPDIPDSVKQSKGVDVWAHWVKFNIPSSGDISLGTNGKGTGDNLEYYGPCPPDREHRYFFKLYALDIELNLEEGATKKEVEDAMEGHILSQAELIGKYERQ